MSLALRRLCLWVALLVIPSPAFAQSLSVTDGAQAMADVEVFIFSGGSKSSFGRTSASGSLGFDPALLRQKNVATGTRVTAYGLTCANGKLRQIVLVPDGVEASQADIGCADRNNLQAGAACTCQRIGAFVFGPTMQVAFRTASSGLLTTRNLLIGGAATAGVITGIALAGGDDNGGSGSGFDLASFSGNYSGTFSQTSTTCNPPAFVAQFAGSVALTLASSGATTAALTESIVRNYTGTLARAGGTLTGSGTFPSGAAWTGTLNVAFTENPTRATITEVITNVARACNAAFVLSNVPRP